MPYTTNGREGEHAADKGNKHTSAALAYGSRGWGRLREADLAKDTDQGRPDAAQTAHQAAADLREAADHAQQAADRYKEAARKADRAARTLSRPRR